MRFIIGTLLGLIGIAMCKIAFGLNALMVVSEHDYGWFTTASSLTGWVGCVMIFIGGILMAKDD